MNLDWKHWAAIVMLLAVLATWGSRERTWTKQLEQVTAEKKTLSDTLAIQRAQNEQLRKDTETVESIEPVLLANGTTAYATHRTSKTIETAMRQSTEQIAQFKQQISDLQVKLTTKETGSVKSAPKFMAGIDWKPMSPGANAFMPKLGMNIGALTIYAGHPIQLALEPHVGLDLRF